MATTGFAQVTVANYAFTGGTATATSTAPSLSASALTTSGTVSISNSSPVSSGYSGASGSYYASDNGWGSTGNYFQFTLTPDSGYSLSLTALDFGYRTSSTSGPTAFSLRSSADNYGATIASGVLSNSDTNWHASGTTSITLSALASATTFRLYASGAATNTPTLRIDDLNLQGTLSAVPEPATYATLAGALALVSVLVRRKRSAKT